MKKTSIKIVLLRIDCISKWNRYKKCQQCKRIQWMNSKHIKNKARTAHEIENNYET